MQLRSLALRSLPALLALLGCGAPPSGDELGEASDALDICSEVVPENRQVNGIPAYAQCDTTTNASIWSNNGVDTSLTQIDADWVRTQRGGGYQCTELAYRYLYFRWNVSYRSGDAQEWCDGALPANLTISPTPVHGDLIVFAGGVCGADASTGHIAVIDTVDAVAAKVTIVEENRAGRRSSNQSCATCFLHAVANDGSAGGAPGAGGATATGGSAGSGGTAGASDGLAGAAGSAGDAGGGAGGLASGGSAGGLAAGAGGAVDMSAGASGVGGAPAAGGSSSGGAGIGASGSGGAAAGDAGAGAGNGGASVSETGGAGASEPSSPAGTAGVATPDNEPESDTATSNVEGTIGCSVRPGHAPRSGASLWLMLGLAALRRRPLTSRAKRTSTPRMPLCRSDRTRSPWSRCIRPSVAGGVARVRSCDERVERRQPEA